MARNITYNSIFDTEAFETDGELYFITPQLLSGTMDLQHQTQGNYNITKQVAGEWRDITSENEDIALRPYYNNSIVEAGGNYVHVVYSGIIKLPPTVIPGSSYIDVSSSLPLSSSYGSTSDTRGHMVLQTQGKNATVALWSRPISIGASGSLASAGSWTYCTSSHPGSSYSLNYASTVSPSATNQCLFPIGTSTGSYVEVRIGFDSLDGSNPAYLGGWSLFFPKLNDI